jgi:hypothetical protein
MPKPFHDPYTGGTYRTPSGGFYCQLCADLCSKRSKSHTLKLGPDQKLKLKLCNRCFKKLKEEICDA